MATISNVNGKKITKIKYKGEICDVGGGGSGGGNPLKEYLDETKNASYMFSGKAYSSSGINTTWYSNLTYKRLEKILSYNTTSSVTSMNGMFYYCYNLTTIPQLDTSNVTSMNKMFYECTNLTTIPQLDTSNVTSMSQMFYKCTNLTTIPQLDTSNVTNAYYMFNQCGNLISVPQLNTNKVSDMSGMFYYCKKLTTIDITHMNIIYTSNGDYIFYGCSSLTKLIIRNMDKTPVLGTSVFGDCYHFTGTTDPTYNPQGLKDGRIYVPDDKVDSLKTAEKWSTYADIIVPLSTLVE